MGRKLTLICSGKGTTPGMFFTALSLALCVFKCSCLGFGDGGGFEKLSWQQVAHLGSILKQLLLEVAQVFLLNGISDHFYHFLQWGGGLLYGRLLSTSILTHSNSHSQTPVYSYIDEQSCREWRREIRHTAPHFVSPTQEAGYEQYERSIKPWISDSMEATLYCAEMIVIVRCMLNSVWYFGWKKNQNKIWKWSLQSNA